MATDNLISGRFVDREAGGPEDGIVDVSDEDIRNYMQGRYGRLTSRQVLFLKEVEDDPDGTRWNAAHADWIFVDPETFLEFLFAWFPADEPWEKNYQDLRALVGPRPIGYAELYIAAMELAKNAAVSSKPPYHLTHNS